MKVLHLVFLTLIILSCQSESQNNEEKEIDLDQESKQALEEANRLLLDKSWESAIIEYEFILSIYPNTSASEKAAIRLIEAQDSLAVFKVTEEKRLEKIIAEMKSKMYIEYDDFEEKSWYRDKSSPRYTNRNGFFLYFSVSDKSNTASNLRLSINYFADDWLFIDSYTIKADDQTFKISEKEYGEIKTDAGNGDIWEWLDRSVGKKELEIVEAIANSESAKIKFHGTDYYDHREISNKEKKALKNVLEAYEALGGDLFFLY